MSIANPDRRRQPPQTLFLAVLALLALVAFLKVAMVIVMPVVLSLFLGGLLSPLIVFLQRRHWPILPAVLAALSVVFLVLILMGLLVLISLQSLGGALPAYADKMAMLADTVNAWVAGYGMDLQLGAMVRNLDPASLAPVLTRSFVFAIDIAKYGTMIFFVTLFLMLEGARFQDKLVRAFGEGNWISGTVRGIGADIQRYILVKTAISAATGFLAWVLLASLGVDFALLWGLLTFALNFIPTVGSIVAAFPPLLTALVQSENPFKQAALVGLGLLAIQTVLGSYLDPRLMGRNLNLSALVIFLSMAFWGWMWGPMGMLIAVPLAVCIKVALSHHPRLKPFALLMEG